MKRGYLALGKSWTEASGNAYFVDGPDKGYLQVSVFGPCYASYLVFELDAEDCRYAPVSGPDRSCLWLRVRAAAVGFDTSKLIFVDYSSLP